VDESWRKAAILADTVNSLRWLCGDGFAYTLSLYFADALRHAGYKVNRVGVTVDNIYMDGQAELTVKVNTPAGNEAYALTVFFKPRLVDDNCRLVRKIDCLWLDPDYDGRCEGADYSLLVCDVYNLETNGGDIWGEAFFQAFGFMGDEECEYRNAGVKVKVSLTFKGTAFARPLY